MAGGASTVLQAGPPLPGPQRRRLRRLGVLHDGFERVRRAPSLGGQVQLSLTTSGRFEGWRSGRSGRSERSGTGSTPHRSEERRPLIDAAAGDPLRARSHADLIGAAGVLSDSRPGGVGAVAVVVAGKRRIGSARPTSSGWHPTSCSCDPRGAVPASILTLQSRMGPAHPCVLVGDHDAAPGEAERPQLGRVDARDAGLTTAGDVGALAAARRSDLSSHLEGAFDSMAPTSALAARAPTSARSPWTTMASAAHSDSCGMRRGRADGRSAPGLERRTASASCTRSALARPSRSCGRRRSGRPGDEIDEERCPPPVCRRAQHPHGDLPRAPVGTSLGGRHA